MFAEKELGGLGPVGVVFPAVLYEAVWMAIDLEGMRTRVRRIKEEGVGGLRG